MDSKTIGEDDAQQRSSMGIMTESAYYYSGKEKRSITVTIGSELLTRRVSFSELGIGELSQASRIGRVHVYGGGAVWQLGADSDSAPAFMSEVPPASTTRSIPGHDCDTEDTHGR
ncbi:hypothetical protein BKA83DRAFT_4128361 [Pisolithus microcarpus]|nr:hypothetical protein BKA83DRAFT_4128361 [Pisolithus microcarpus]